MKKKAPTSRNSKEKNRREPALPTHGDWQETIDQDMRIPDSEIRANLVAQTVDLRFSVKSQGLRNLLSERGHDPMRCIQIACDQGDDVSLELVLEDSTAVRINYREHYRSRQAIRVVDWEILDGTDREIEMCQKIVSSRDFEFNDDVREYFAQQLATEDAPLPGLNWGDRPWHAFESPPD